MNYPETLDFLYSRLPMFQRIGPAAYKNNLDNILFLDNLYGHPHRRFRTIHVAGTNGKGSVSHMLAAVLQSAGYKTGLYTSPHLKDFRERIKIDGRMISREEVIEWVERYRNMPEAESVDPSFFEITVAMAFDIFARRSVDIAVIEVGLGGRLDSTNIITPEVSVITNIGLDHTALLGDSPDKIAFEKAGIIKSGIPVVAGTCQKETINVFKAISSEKGSPLYIADREYKVSYALTDIGGNQLMAVENEKKKFRGQLKIDLRGMYQKKNLPAVLKTTDILKEKGWVIKDPDIAYGLAHVRELTGLSGRWQIIGNNPLIVADIAHNADGISEVVRQIKQTPFKKLHIVFGIVNDKDPDAIFKLLPSGAEYYFTKADIPRAMDEKELVRHAAESGISGNTFSSVREALDAAHKNADKNDLIFVGGSTFVVAEIL